MNRFHSLRTKLVVAFALLGLGPLLFMAGITLYSINTAHRQDISIIEMGLLRQKLSEIEKFIEDTAGLLELRVGFSEDVNIAENDQKFLLEKLLELDKDISRAAFADLQGQETYKLTREGPDSALRIINSTPEFQTAKKGTRYLGPVHYTEGGPMMTFAAPVFNRENHIVMVLTAEVSLQPISTIVATTRLDQQIYLYAVDQNGKIVASGDKDRIKKDLGGLRWVRQILEGERHTSLEKQDERDGLIGIPVIAAGIPYPKLGWAMIAEWSRQDALSVIARVQYNLLFFASTTILVIVAAGWFLGRRVLGPLGTLKEASEKLGRGTFDVKTKISTGDELELLGEALNQAAEGLKKIQELRTVEVRSAALAESLQKEKDVSLMKDQFISNISHQLRTPLSILNWNVELLGEAKKPTERKQSLADLTSALNQLNPIVNDLLAVSEFGPGFKNTVMQDVKLVDILSAVKSPRESAIQEKKITVTVEGVDTLPLMKGNPRALQLALEHMIENTVTYTLGGGMIKITGTMTDNKITLSFQDSGIGIPAADKTLIFTPFFRAANAIRARNVGTGLGLHIIKNIIEGHGGAVSFESEESKGSTFRIMLPVGTVGEPVPPTPTPAPAPNVPVVPPQAPPPAPPEVAPVAAPIAETLAVASVVAPAPSPIPDAPATPAPVVTPKQKEATSQEAANTEVKPSKETPAKEPLKKKRAPRKKKEPTS